MKEKFDMIKSFVLGNKIKVILGVAVLIALLSLFGGTDNSDLTAIKPTFGTLKESVKATGVVTSKVNLDLSFKKSGIVKSVSYDVGDKVKAGQVLASLSAGSEAADISRARANVALAEAKLKKILEGATSEEINLAKVALSNSKTDLSNAKNTQNTLVKNAYVKLLNSSLEARSEGLNDNRTAPTISGNYNLNQEGSINISVYNTGSGLTFSTSGLITSTGYVNTTNPQPIGNSGLYILFASTSNLTSSNFIIDIPNKKASDYLTNQNAYDSALKTKDATLSSLESVVAQKEAELILKQAAARPSDLDLAQAEILSAKAGLAQASSNYEDTIIRAPKDGTITAVNIKYGETVDTSKPALVLEDITNLYVEAPINESNIKNINLDQNVEIIFDALGVEKVFNGLVSHIDPSAATSDGVVNYKIKVSISTKDTNIRPGMNAEIAITTSTKDDVLSLPKAYLITKDGINYVNLVTNIKNNDYKEVRVETGLEGDGNMIEIISGINKEDSIVLITQ